MDSLKCSSCSDLLQRIADLEIQLANERNQAAAAKATAVQQAIVISALKRDIDAQNSAIDSSASLPGIPKSSPESKDQVSQATQSSYVSRAVSPIPFLLETDASGSRKRHLDSSNPNSDSEAWGPIKRARYSEDSPSNGQLNAVNPVDPYNGRPLTVPLARLPLPGVKGSDPQCANCGTKQTPMWRRGANLELNCNACALYAKLHNCPRPCNGTPTAPRPRSRPSGGSYDRKSGSKSAKPLLIGGPCTACQTQTTPLWRKDAMGRTLCNACGLRRKTNPKEPIRASAPVDCCAECRTTSTPMWRRDATGRLLCNACGLRQKMYRAGRHITFGGDMGNSPLPSMSPQPTAVA